MEELKKIYYNNEGWVCQRYPYDIPIDDENRFIEVSNEVYQQTFSCPQHYSWLVVNGELKVERYEDTPALETYQEELDALNNWFTDIYDMQIKQSERCVRLGIEYDNKYGTIEELDKKAIENSKRISELKKLLAEYEL